MRNLYNPGVGKEFLEYKKHEPHKKKLTNWT